MPQIDIIDAEGAVRAYLTGYPGLTGPGNPIEHGIHLSRLKVPNVGAVADLRLINPRRSNDVVDTARVAFRVIAGGKERQPRDVAERGCRALAKALRALTGRPVVVQTRRGEWVKILAAGEDAAGPTFGGEGPGSAMYLFDVTLAFQPAAAPA